MNGVTSYLRKILLRDKASSESYVAHLREIGVKVGEDVKFYAPSTTIVDEQYPWMISIGNHVRIAQGALLLTHDYSWAVLKRLQIEDDSMGGVFGASGQITIGDNVFIGMNAAIMRGVTIGDDVIIGVGSVVTKDCQSGGVYAGNPARRIAETADFYKKRKDAQLAEAVDLAQAYYARYGKKPDQRVFREYFMLFTRAEEAAEFSEVMDKCGNPDDSYAYLAAHPPMFDGFNAFLEYCFPTLSNPRA